MNKILGTLLGIFWKILSWIHIRPRVRAKNLPDTITPSTIPIQFGYGDEKLFWKAFYREYFEMEINPDDFFIPTIASPYTHDLVFVCDASIAELYKKMSERMKLHDLHTYVYGFNQKSELAKWDDGDIVRLRNPKITVYAIWLPKVHNYDHEESVVEITLLEYLLQIAMIHETGQSWPKFFHQVGCLGTKTEHGRSPSVELRYGHRIAGIVVHGSSFFKKGDCYVNAADEVFYPVAI